MPRTKPDPFAKRLEKYMAKSGIHFEGPRQLVAYHLAQFAHRERRLMRREIAPAIRSLRAVPHDIRAARVAILAADAIARATKAGKGGARAPRTPGKTNKTEGGLK